MIYYTLLGKTVHCDRWNIDVALSAKYIFSRDPKKPYEAHFAFATCPIAENCQIHPYDQDEKYKYMRCEYSAECTLLRSFKPVVDTRKNDC